MISEDTTLVIDEATKDFRLHRLQAFSYMLDLDGKNILRLIESVSDHKGWVTVNWKVEPTNEEMAIIPETWSRVNEEPSCHTHLFNGKEIHPMTWPILAEK
jgi:hypothetical protein